MLTAYQLGFIAGSMQNCSLQLFKLLHADTEYLVGYYDAKVYLNHLEGFEITGGAS